MEGDLQVEHVVISDGIALDFPVGFSNSLGKYAASQKRAVEALELGGEILFHNTPSLDIKFQRARRNKNMD